MARWFRLERMEYTSLILNEDAAHGCLDDLGKVSVVQFTDVNIVVSHHATKPPHFRSLFHS